MTSYEGEILESIQGSTVGRIGWGLGMMLDLGIVFRVQGLWMIRV